ncbi:outer membrane beta-barrel protein, partial [uncultured Chryseobacterium sp.]|uniref:outer membrane beta-barrel protein n=1 Tax=uncultured Chryseobacterium sp. TaxID=259322 RepID=UPI00338EBCAB
LVGSEMCIRDRIKTGTVYLSGQVGYSQEKDNNTDSKDQNFSVVPTVGIFIAPNLAVGTGIGYTGSRADHKDITNIGSGIETVQTIIKTNAFTAQPFIRKYWTLSDKLYIFGQLEVPIEIGKRTADLQLNYFDINGYTYFQSMSIEQKYTSFGVNVKPGLDYFINKNWTIEATIGEFGYKNTKIKDQDNGTDTFNFGLNLSSVMFGVKYVFAK